MCDLIVSLRLGWVQSLKIQDGVAILTDGLREPPRAPLHPKKLLRSTLFGEAVIRKTKLSLIC